MIATDSFLFLFLSMIIIAASLYLPQHITNIASRALFYYAGEDEEVGRSGDTGGGVGGYHPEKVVMSSGAEL